MAHFEGIAIITAVTRRFCLTPLNNKKYNPVIEVLSFSPPASRACSASASSQFPPRAPALHLRGCRAHTQPACPPWARLVRVAQSPHAAAGSCTYRWQQRIDRACAHIHTPHAPLSQHHGRCFDRAQAAVDLLGQRDVHRLWHKRHAPQLGRLLQGPVPAVGLQTGPPCQACLFCGVQLLLQRRQSIQVAALLLQGLSKRVCRNMCVV